MWSILLKVLLTVTVDIADFLVVVVVDVFVAIVVVDVFLAVVVDLNNSKVIFRASKHYQLKLIIS